LIAHVTFFISLHALQHAQGEEKPEHMDQITPVAVLFRVQRDAGLDQVRFRGQCGGGLFHQSAESDLAVASFQYSQRQAEQDVTSAVERFAVLGIGGKAGGVLGVAGNLAEPGGLGGDGQTPSGVMGEPLPQPFRMLPY
jgi:hypothetical protein